MIFPYPFFAGALPGALCAGVFAGLATGVAPAGTLGAISALIEKVKV
jgi:hypothetical protein